jgi:thioesterase domain-containing protein
MNGEFASSVHLIAQHYVDAITDFQPDGPLILGGWSAGSFIALEMAQLLRQRGRDVPLLIALDGSLYKDGPDVSAWHPRYYRQMARNLIPWIADKLSEGWPVRRTAHRIAQNVRRAIVSTYSSNPNANRGHSVDALLDIAEWPPEQAAFVRVLFETVERYEPQTYNGKVIVYVAKTQPLFRPGQVESTWKKFAPYVEFINVDGTHANMIREPRVTALATNLRVRLNKLISIQGQPMNSPPEARPFKATPRILFSMLG